MFVFRRAAQRGFTLLELLVVLLITALLVGYVGPKYFSHVDTAKERTAMTQMKSLSDALGQYRLDVGQYPSEETGLDALVMQPAGVSNWRGPYLSKGVPKDPWGNAYQWHNPARTGDTLAEVELVSYGADGRPGGEGVNKDLVFGF